MNQKNIFSLLLPFLIIVSFVDLSCTPKKQVNASFQSNDGKGVGDLDDLPADCKQATVVKNATDTKCVCHTSSSGAGANGTVALGTTVQVVDPKGPFAKTTTKTGTCYLDVQMLACTDKQSSGFKIVSSAAISGKSNNESVVSSSGDYVPADSSSASSATANQNPTGALKPYVAKFKVTPNEPGRKNVATCWDKNDSRNRVGEDKKTNTIVFAGLFDFIGQQTGDNYWRVTQRVRPAYDGGGDTPPTSDQPNEVCYFESANISCAEVDKNNCYPGKNTSLTKQSYDRTIPARFRVVPNDAGETPTIECFDLSDHGKKIKDYKNGDELYASSRVTMTEVGYWFKKIVQRSRVVYDNNKEYCIISAKDLLCIEDDKNICDQ